MNDFRHEIKYVLTDNDFYLIDHNLNTIIKKDKNCIDNSYTISSLYFDTFKKTSYNQVKNGLSERWKYRIRFYNYDDSFIKLEKKYKINGMTKKNSVVITREVFDSILNRNIKISKSNKPLLNEFIIKMETELLRPLIFIEYDRIPYVYKLGNVRITLDYNIRYTNRFNKLFNKARKNYYLSSKILEVKYDTIIPDFIRYKLELNHLEETSFSKFNKCIEDFNSRRNV